MCMPLMGSFPAPRFPQVRPLRPTPKAVAGCSAEWRPAETILMQPPDPLVLFLGTCTPPGAALYEKRPDAQKAVAQHGAFMETLREEDIAVLTVESLLLDDRRALLDLARERLTHDLSQLSEEQEALLAGDKGACLDAMAPHQLWQVVLLGIVATVRETGTNTGLAVDGYKIKPLLNLHFTRDQTVTTNDGVIICSMTDERAFETAVLKSALARLGIRPICEVGGKGRLEGGDVVMAGEGAFVGVGLRTNIEGVEQVMEAGGFASNGWVAMVNNPRTAQDEMHLDTFFNVIDENLVILRDPRLGERPTVDVYEQRKGEFVRATEKADFAEFLAKKGFEIVAVSKSDQLDYGCNFLTLRPRVIAAVAGSMSPSYREALTGHGVTIIDVPFDHMTATYGGPHCTTQVLRRTGLPEFRPSHVGSDQVGSDSRSGTP